MTKKPAKIEQKSIRPNFCSKTSDSAEVPRLAESNWNLCGGGSIMSEIYGTVSIDVLLGMKQAGINQGFWVMFLGLIPWFSTITRRKLINSFSPLYSELFKSVVPFFF